MISAGYKVHPLWQSYEMLPLFSVLTAFIMGFSIVIFEGSLVQAGLKGNGPDEKNLFVKLTNTISVLLAIFRRPALWRTDLSRQAVLCVCRRFLLRYVLD